MNKQVPEIAPEQSKLLDLAPVSAQGKFSGNSFYKNLHQKGVPAPCCRVWSSISKISEKPIGVLRLFALRAQRLVVANDRGAVTAEYAIVIMAAVAFAGLLVAIMSSGEVRAMLVGMVQRALGSAG